MKQFIKKRDLMSDECKSFKDFVHEEDGMGTVEIILIIVVLIGLVIIFKNQITAIVNNLFGKITNEVDNF